MALQPSPRQQVHIPATVPTQEPAQLGMTLIAFRCYVYAVQANYPREWERR